MKPAIGITEKHLEKSSKLLSVLLGDEMTLYIKTRSGPKILLTMYES